MPHKQHWMKLSEGSMDLLGTWKYFKEGNLRGKWDNVESRAEKVSSHFSPSFSSLCPSSSLSPAPWFISRLIRRERIAENQKGVHCAKRPTVTLKNDRVDKRHCGEFRRGGVWACGREVAVATVENTLTFLGFCPKMPAVIFLWWEICNFRYFYAHI